MFVLQFDAEHRARKHFRNLTFNYQMIFFRHFSVFPGLLTAITLPTEKEAQRKKRPDPKTVGSGLKLGSV